MYIKPGDSGNYLKIYCLITILPRKKAIAAVALNLRIKPPLNGFFHCHNVMQDTL